MPSLFHKCLALDLEIEASGDVETMKALAAEILNDLGEDPTNLEGIGSFVFDDRLIVISHRNIRARKVAEECLRYFAEAKYKRFVYDGKTFHSEVLGVVRRTPVLK